MKLVIAVLGILLVAVGCQTYPPAAAQPSDQKTPLVLNDASRDVLMKYAESDKTVMASVLESMQESGTGIMIDHSGYVYDPQGNVVFGPDKKPLKIRTVIVAKLNDLANLQDVSNIGELDYSIGSFDYVDKLPKELKGKDLCPEAFHLSVKSVDGMHTQSNVAEMRRAAGEERAVILAGLSEYARARGAAFATKVTALENGMVKIITAAGSEIVGRVIGTKPVEVAIKGASDVVSAAIQTDDGMKTVVAEGKTAKELTPAD